MSKIVKKEFTKKDPVEFNPNEMYQSILELPPGIQEEIESKGLVARWINLTEYKRQYGFHRSGWAPYKPETALPATNSLAGDAEGYIKRGDLILAVKTNEQQNLHKRRLKHKADLYKGYNAEKAKEIRDLMRNVGIKTKVVEGYEEPGEVEDDE